MGSPGLERTGEGSLTNNDHTHTHTHTRQTITGLCRVHSASARSRVPGAATPQASQKSCGSTTQTPAPAARWVNKQDCYWFMKGSLVLPSNSVTDGLLSHIQAHSPTHTHTHTYTQTHAHTFSGPPPTHTGIAPDGQLQLSMPPPFPFQPPEKPQLPEWMQKLMQPEGIQLLQELRQESLQVRGAVQRPAHSFDNKSCSSSS